MAENTVLVLTAPVDPTADLVILKLQARGVPLARVDSGSFPASGRMTAEIGPAGGWSLSLEADGQEVASADVSAIYYRRPRAFAFSESLAETHRPWSEGQMRYGFWGALESLDVAWINRPGAVAAAEYKPRQLALARTVGLAIPATLVSNDPRAVAAFAAEQGRGVVTKALYARGPRAQDGSPSVVLYTTRVPAARTGDPSIALTAHLVQEFIPKAYDVRLTVVDGHLYAAAIDDADPENVEDWRRSHHGLTYRVCAVPPEVAKRVRTLVDRLGLRFAALDFVVTPEGDWVFIEVNPNGQWAWIEHQTGLPIAAGIAEALATSVGAKDSWP